MVKTLCAQYRGYGSDPWSGKIPHALWCAQKIKKKISQMIHENILIRKVKQ